MGGATRRAEAAALARVVLLVLLARPTTTTTTATAGSGKAAPPCRLPVQLVDVACEGMAGAHGVATAAECAALCCADQGCSTWLFCTNATTCHPEGGELCWTSGAACHGAAAGAWVGASAIPLPTPTPRPPAQLIAAGSAANATAPRGTWFGGLPVYHIPPSVAPSVPAASPARYVVYAAPVLSLSLFPLDPSSDFVLEMTSLDDGGHRSYGVAVAGATGPECSLGNVTLSEDVVFAHNLSLPHSCIVRDSDGTYRLDVAFTLLAGPNVALSAIRVFSSNASDPAIRPPLNPEPTHALPRLTPVASAIPGLAGSTTLDLNGAWRFSPNAWNSSIPLVPIQVPGEYTLQGFDVPAGQPTVYVRAFTAPAAWAGGALRVKLRFDAVYSLCNASLNGEPIGGHLGGMTPFELDVSAAVRFGAANTLVVWVTGVSLADKLASGSRYAAHDLGGITRKVRLVAVPAAHVANVHAVTLPNPTAAAAAMRVNLTLANEGASPTACNATVTLAPLASPAHVVAREQAAVSGLQPGGALGYAAVLLAVQAPLLWDAEHPNLYLLSATLVCGPSHTEGAAALLSSTTTVEVGLREVRVVGNQIVINGHPITARGTTRHETHQTLGRSLWFAGATPGGQWEADIRLLRDLNINYIRTSHYPPAEELMLAANRLGMFIEVEMPFCWAAGNSGSLALNYTVQAQSEALLANRNHPSVIHWSLGNESPWLANFRTSYLEYLKPIDSSRPFMFDGGSGQPVPPLNLTSHHYPGFPGPVHDATSRWPVLYGEYAHLNCYNRRELATDPGLRDNWAVGMSALWEDMYHTQAVLGGCFWAGIDDQFLVPSKGALVGYGPWGFIDGWRRHKPEAFLIKNTYTPVVLTRPPGPFAGSLLAENRHDFSDLSELSFSWALSGGATGRAACACPPRTNATLALSGFPASGAAGQRLTVNATSPRGFSINTWVYDLGPAGARPHGGRFGAGGTAQGWQLSRPRAGGCTAVSGDVTWAVAANGSLAARVGGEVVMASGPDLLVLRKIYDSGQIVVGRPNPPYTEPCSGWEAAAVTCDPAGKRATITGKYANATGQYTLTFGPNQTVEVAYSFAWRQPDPVDVRQYGISFVVPAAHGHLSWERIPQFATVYPDDHIGRPVGSAVPANPGARPVWTHDPGQPWAADQAPLGTNDFRSTKHHIQSCSLHDAAARLGVSILSNGSQHCRSWVEGGTLRTAALDMSNEGGNPFASRDRVLPTRTLHTGDTVQGAVTLRVWQAAAGDHAEPAVMPAEAAGQGSAPLHASGPPYVSGMTHGWDCVMCAGNSMLVGNFGSFRADFNMSDPWWIHTIASSYRAVALNAVLGSRAYNGTGESGQVTVARALKAANPDIKILWYQAADRVGDSTYIHEQLQAHREWWLKDDHGNYVWFQHKEGHPTFDPSTPEARSWFINLPLTLFENRSEGQRLCDGIMVDGAGFREITNISHARYQQIFDAKMQMMREGQDLFLQLNGGEIWGNPLMQYGSIGPIPNRSDPMVNWNATLFNYNGAFDEMFGSFSTQTADGEWDPVRMALSFESIINASQLGHSIVIHAYPGPATVPFQAVGPASDAFHIPSWAGPEPAPTDPAALRKAMQARLVESLAPFLIVANERVFLGYGWFYNIEDGYIPCPEGVECGMPAAWFPEFGRPLGPPAGPAVRSGFEWRRDFAHASVFVDVRNRSASAIAWR